jgi:hypothetical protein
MKAVLTLNNPLWNTPARLAILNKAVQQSAAELETKIKETIQNSIPAGKIYLRGAITAQATKKALALGLLRKAGTKTRIQVGTRFHRASARGQPPAVDSGRLLKSIEVKKTGALQVTVFSNAPYSDELDNPNKLNRPFIRKNRDDFRRKFKQNIADAIRGVKTT